jgi:SNF2 family DNA or RNA helicase
MSTPPALNASGRAEAPWDRKRKRWCLLTPETVEAVLHASAQPMAVEDPMAELTANLSGLGLCPRAAKRHKTTHETFVEAQEEIKQAEPLQNRNVYDLVPLNEPFHLYAHQRQAVLFFAGREEQDYHGIRGGIGAIEMGLGKSLIALTLVLHKWQPGQCATLYLCQKTLLPQVMMDARKFYGDRISVLGWERSILTPDVFMQFSRETAYRNHVVIVTYDTLLTLGKAVPGMLKKGKGGNAKLAEVAQAFFQTPWFRVVADESQRLANHSTVAYEAAMQLLPGRRLCMSGTPQENYEDDTFSQLVFCGLNLTDTRRWTIQMYKQMELGQAVLVMSVEDSQIKLPPKTRKRVMLSLTAHEKAVYNNIMDENELAMARFKSKNTTFANVLEAFTRLRQVAVAAHLICPHSKDLPFHKMTPKEKQRMKPGTLHPDPAVDAWVRDRRLAGQQSTKMRSLVTLLANVPTEDKVLIFSEWTTSATLAGEALATAFEPAAVMVVHGKTKNRENCFARFRQDPKVRFLCMTRIGVLGLNLTEANHVVLLDPSWTDKSSQSVARAWRLGQTKPVFVWELLVRNSVEQKLLDLCAAKHDLRDVLLSEGIKADVIEAFIGEKLK